MLSKKRFITILTDNKYPKWYAMRMAISLKKYGWSLVCFIDENPNDSYPKLDNLTYFNIRLLVPDNMKFIFKGWWYKLLFFNSVHFDKVLFIDVDTLIMNNPDTILDFINYDNFHSLITPSDWLAPKIATPLMFIDHSKGTMSHIWDAFYGADITQFNGDQEFIHKCVNEKFGDFKDAVWTEFPVPIMASYKCWFDKRWKNSFGGKRQRQYIFSDFTTCTFNGEPSVEDVIKNKLEGYEYFLEYEYHG